MKWTVKLQAEEWLFAREFAYIDETKPLYSFKKRLWEKKKQHEPSPLSRVPYVTMDEEVLFINHLNEPGTWMKWEWEKTKSIRLYHAMHPWKASIFSWFQEADTRRERRRTKRYLRTMRRRYKMFSNTYEETYTEQYALLLEGKNRNAQIWIPSSWLEENNEWFLDKMESISGKKITYGGLDEHWKDVRHRLLKGGRKKRNSDS